MSQEHYETTANLFADAVESRGLTVAISKAETTNSVYVLISDSTGKSVGKVRFSDHRAWYDSGTSNVSFFADRFEWNWSEWRVRSINAAMQQAADHIVRLVAGNWDRRSFMTAPRSFQQVVAKRAGVAGNVSGLRMIGLMGL